MKKTGTTSFIETEQLAAYGEAVAEQLRPCGTRGSGRHEAARIRAAAAKLEQLVRMTPPTAIEPEAEWLSDNLYLIRQASRQTAVSLQHAKALRLSEDGRPLICVLADWLVRAGNGDVNEARMEQMMIGFQRICALEERELSLIVPALTGALICQLSEAPESAEAVFGALRWLRTAELWPLLERQDVLERLFLQDPTGVYPRMDPESRADYRRRAAGLARKAGLAEPDAAGRILRLAAEQHDHLGRFLYTEPLGRKKQKPRTGWYIALCMLLPLVLSALLWRYTNRIAAALLCLIPLGEAVKYLVDRVVSAFVKPHRLPRMDYRDGIPPESRTLAVMAVLLDGPEAARTAVRKLEQYRLANRDAGSGLLLGLLVDLPEAGSEALEADRATLAAAADEIETLQEGYCLLTRPRSHHAPDGVWRGWERKRGAVLQLCARLCGRESSIQLLAGDASCLEDIRYLIVIDGDTTLTVGSAARLAGIIAHPLQKPVLDYENRCLLSGVGIVQPRISVSLADASRSDFARLFAGQGGIDPYGTVNSELYQDLFGEATFSGKGILDVEAFCLCLKGRFPLHTLLSHDLVEGAYLGCAYAGDIELTDGFPASLLSYYTRQHRWIRGDWQTIRWLLRHVRDEAGCLQRNPISALSRWKILDNLRRSLTPAAVLLSLLLCGLFDERGFRLAAMINLLCLAVKVFICSAGSLRSLRRKHRSSVLTAGVRSFLELLCLFLLLPYAAWVSISAVCTALYRQLISHRRLLDWITAAQGDRGGTAVYRYLCRMWFSFPAGLLALIGVSIPVKTLGLLWLFAPFLGQTISRERTAVSVSEEHRLFLLHCAGDIWRYYQTQVNEASHWLPPDNVQEEPEHRIASRTSPTNIGLMLLSCVAAWDLGLIERQEAFSRISLALDTVEQLPRCRGHLLNWYATDTLQPLKPAFVSTVDSGNLIACLIALETAAREAGEEAVAQRAQKLEAEMKLDFLYDPSRRLLRIGWDAEQDAPTEGCYDLLASEARTASYLAIARGEAPAKHWRQLGRTLVGTAASSGLASWTGTMFEYMMPALLLPCPRGSLLDDSLRFAVREQRRVRAGGVWGRSESAYFSLDAALNYRYQAHGVQALALKRGMDLEHVVAPYASFLALPCGVGSAIRNLRRLQKLGAEGPYGYCEALDFTEERTLGSRFRLVRCWMSHHLAMSLLATDNALNENRMQRRLMADPRMAAHSQLLEERSPVGARIPTDSIAAEPKRPIRDAAEGFQLCGEGVCLETPFCALLSGGRCGVLLTELGANRTMWGQTMLAACHLSRFSPEQGILFFADHCGELCPLQPTPAYDAATEYHYAYDGSSFRQYAVRSGLSYQIETTIPLGASGELRSIRVQNNTPEAVELTLGCFYLPVLATPAAYTAHPAFSRLCLSSRMIQGCLVTSRRPGGSEPAVSAAVCCSEAFEAETDLASAFGRGGLYAIAAAMRRSGSDIRDAEEPCVFLRVHLSLHPHGSRTVRFAFAFGDTPLRAAEAAQQLRPVGTEDIWFHRQVQAYGMREQLLSDAFRLLTPLVYPTAEQRGLKPDGATPGREALWRLGVSGDDPVVLSEREHNEASLRIWAFLTAMGARYDLLLPVEDAGIYGRPEETALLSLAALLGVSASVGQRGGFHIVSLTSRERCEVLAFCAACGLPALHSRTHFSSAEPLLLPACSENRSPRSVEFEADGAVRFRTTSGIGLRAWSLPMTNGKLGYLAVDSGCGFLWWKNAREDRLTPWGNDPLALDGPEMLELIRDGRSISLFADADEFETEVTYGFGWARWRRQLVRTQIELLAFLPLKENARVFLLRTCDARPGDRIRWRVRPEPGAQGRLRLLSGESSLHGGVGEAERHPAQLCGEPLLEKEYPATDSMALVLSAEEQSACTRPSVALAELERTKTAWQRLCGAIHVRTPDAALNAYLNGWALYQTLACRLLARTSLYQSGGAFGFRDQLQDICAIVDVLPGFAQRHLLEAAAHQYEEGDVMHWWHPQDTGDKGVRTRCSDDLLWLPYAVSVYVEKTGDRAILERKAAWLHSAVLTEAEHDRYEQPERVGEDSLREHCLRAIDLVLRRGVGPHGLLRFGAGDWNDGLDRVDGESVWLTWFAAWTLQRFGVLLDDDALKREAACLGRAADAAWADGRYLRGWYADGRPLGAADSEACALDSLGQSFAVLSGFGSPEKVRPALRLAVETLPTEESQLIRLFTPPFDGADDPGYIRSYLPGVRENGGQYTHAAVWLAAACLRCGETEQGCRLLRMLLPGGRDERVYQTEPFVLAADVYANRDMQGRGGWSWYTGAAGWFLRTAVEDLLGIRTKEGRLTVDARLPADWPGYEADYLCGGKSYHIRVFRGEDGVQTEISPGKALRPEESPDEILEIMYS